MLMNIGKLILAAWLLVLCSYQTHGQTISQQYLLQLQADFKLAEQQFDARLADSPSDMPTSIELNLQKAQLYMLFQRADLLQPLLSNIEPQVKTHNDPLMQSQWQLFSGIQFYLVGEYLKAQESFSLSLQSLAEQNHQQEYVYLENFILMYQAINNAYLQQYEESLSALTDIFKRAEKNNWPIIQARSLVFIGEVNYTLQNYEQALEYYHNAFISYPNDALIYKAEAQMYQAQMVNIVGERSVAFAQLEQAIAVFEELHDEVRLANAYLLKSYFYSKVPDNNKALEWIAKSVVIREN